MCRELYETDPYYWQGTKGDEKRKIKKAGEKRRESADQIMVGSNARPFTVVVG